MLHYSIQSKITKDIDCYKALLSSISNNLHKGEIFTILREGYGMLTQHFIKIPRIQHHHQTTMYLQNIYRHLEYATQLPQILIYIHIYDTRILAISVWIGQIKGFTLCYIVQSTIAKHIWTMFKLPPWRYARDYWHMAYKLYNFLSYFCD